ncbi:interferon gamma receptor 2 [Suncus etruscus]|uniref:interferon gamma receptor 2 n=1 Tax=Suncus etruscus TaxID=109475 RepID=UPI00210FE09B|nr:interferon gamma receptor 2 [Suncus etruscus]
MPLWRLLLLLLLRGLAAAAPPTDSPAQLPAPQNLKILLYNTEQVLSWDPVSPLNDAKPVTYQVQFKYTSSQWSDVKRGHPPNVDCSFIMATVCNFTAGKGFPYYFNISLRVRARQDSHTSAWTSVPWFQHYRNVTIGPPKNLSVTSRKGALFVTFSAPFNKIDHNRASFQYFVQYGEEAGTPKVKGPFKSNYIKLTDVRPERVYCVRVCAQLYSERLTPSAQGLYSNTTCTQILPDDSSQMQQVIFVIAVTFLGLIFLLGICFFLILRYGVYFKRWFHTPPSIPLQIEEYLKDPAQPFTETLDQDNSQKEDSWDPVSIVSMSPSSHVNTD